MKHLYRFILVLLGGVLGYHGASYIIEQGLIITSTDPQYITAAFIAVGALVGLIISPFITKRLAKWFSKLVRMPSSAIAGGVFGLVIGLVIAILVFIPLQGLAISEGYVPVIISLLLGTSGWAIGVRQHGDFPAIFHRGLSKGSSLDDKKDIISPKILDTSVIIDGRISDITRSGFIEGPLIVPSFVLEELQHIADSSDVLKRNRGRRGLDILNKIQKEPFVTVQIMEKDYEEISEVDSKLVKLAKEMDAKVVTNDYNLNKVCELQGVAVLNINELANAVKPVVLPGEELHVNVIKDGKEQGQGVAYLDDGTMIVVDGGRRYIGETIGVLVTSVLQTAAGRMIFAKPKVMEKAL